MTIQPNYIAGEWSGSMEGADNINPSNVRDIVGTYARADRDDVAASVAAACAAFETWQFSTPQQRADILDFVGSALLQRKDEIGKVLAREEGKTLAEAIGETARAGQIFKFFAQECLRIAGDILPSVRPGIDVEVVREPVGVIAIITPWNFPIAIPAWKIAPALAYGNCVVFKPADLTPACAHILAQLLDEAGIPKGVFNLLVGRGSIVGQALVDHDDVDAISFTGSVGVGRQLAADAAKTLKKIQLEMGGKNPMVVLADADLEVAVDACLNGAFFSTGQRCTASSRLIIEDSIYDAFVDQLLMKTQALIVGNALDPKTQIGPVVSASQRASNLEYIALAKSEGADVIGGEQLDCVDEGFYQAPALFLNATNAMRIAREEIFGPCATLIKADDFEHALTLANDTDFGLSAGICTRSLTHARTFKKRAQAGMVMVNVPTAGVDYHVPFGGRKSSSHGPREQGRYAAEFYTTVKTCYTG